MIFNFLSHGIVEYKMYTYMKKSINVVKTLKYKKKSIK